MRNTGKKLLRTFLASQHEANTDKALKLPYLIHSLLTLVRSVILTPILEKVSNENVGRRQVAGALVVAPTAL